MLQVLTQNHSLLLAKSLVRSISVKNTSQGEINVPFFSPTLSEKKWLPIFQASPNPLIVPLAAGMPAAKVNRNIHFVLVETKTVEWAESQLDSLLVYQDLLQ